MTLPNFLIIGDLKAGSTSLYHYLRQHPEVYMPAELKELRFFSYDHDNPYHTIASSSRVRTIEEYESFFAASGDAIAIGEASPNYLRSPLAAGKIKSLLPHAKLIVTIRNPADRLYSLYLMSRRHRSMTLTFEEKAFSEDAAWIKGNACWPELSRYFGLFDRRQLKVVLFDDLTRDPQAVVTELCAFLEIDTDHTPEFAVFNRGGVPKHRFAYSAMVRVKNLLKSAGFAPAPLRRLWANIRNQSMVKPPINETTRLKVIEVCRDDILRTQDLVQRDLTKWLD